MAAHDECPVIRQPDGKPLPAQYSLSEPVRRATYGSPAQPLLIVLGLLILGWVSLRFLPRTFNLTTSVPSATAFIPARTETPVPPSPSPIPTFTLAPTLTQPPPLHVLEMPIQVGSTQFLIHKVGGGETFEMVAASYQTTPEVIRALNVSIKTSLWANTLIVIAPGQKIVDPSLPVFQTYQVSEATTIEALAVKLNVDPVLLAHYNDCDAGCPLTAGDWLILPLSK